jgi:splicing factor 3B subunit 1
MNKFGETPTPRRFLKSKWDDKTPMQGATPGYGGMTPMSGMTPMGGMTPGMMGITPERLKQLKWEKEIQDRNRYQTDEELNEVLPKNGFEVIYKFNIRNVFIITLTLYK